MKTSITVPDDAPLDAEARTGQLSKRGHTKSVLENGQTRCSDCGARSYDPTLLEEIPCTSKEPDLSDIEHTQEPMFPNIGDLWLDEVQELWLWKSDGPGCSWWNVRTHEESPGQLQMNVSAYNTKLMTYTASASVMTLPSLADEEEASVRQELLVELDALLEKYGAIGVDNPVYKFDPTGLRIECSISVRGRVIPKGMR